VLTGDDDRERDVLAFALAALEPLVTALDGA
jgi:hypothetical protein